MARGLVIGIVATIVFFGLAAYLGIKAGLMPANADGKPSKLERWAATTSLHATLDRDAPTRPPPIPLNDTNLIAGIHLYAENCRKCHGAADAKPSNVALGL